MEGISREESARLPSSNDLKGYGRDTQGRIHPTSFLERPERVIEGIPREESARLPSLNDSKRLWKGFPGKKPLDWGFQKG
jgi:hypothetical protein